MGRRVSSFRFVRRSFHKEGVAFLLGILALVVSLFTLLQAMKYAGLLSPTGAAEATLHGVSFERAAYERGPEKSVILTLKNGASAAGTRGEQNVSLFSFTLSSDNAAKVKRMVFSPSDSAGADDLKSLQLYVDGEFAIERAFYEGQGVFDNLHLRLHPKVELRVDVTGEVSSDARPGHRVKIGFAREEDIVAVNLASQTLVFDAEFPFWGPAISVIGSPL